MPQYRGLFHRLTHKHISPSADSIGYLHFCTNRITRHTKVYFKLPNSDEWKEIPLQLAKRLMLAETPENARMLLFWNGLLDGN